MLKKTIALAFALSMIIGTTTALTSEQQVDLDAVCKYAGDGINADIACADICRQQGNPDGGKCDAKDVCQCTPKKQPAKSKSDAEAKHDKDDERN